MDSACFSIEQSWGYSWINELSLEGTPVFDKYVQSYLWALTQLHGSSDIWAQNNVERVYMISVLFVLFLVSSIVVSSMTTSMTQLQIVTAGETRRFALLKLFLRDNGITSELAIRVQSNAKCAVQQQKRDIQEDDVALLAQISPSLQVGLHLEMNLPVLSTHPFFQVFSPLNQPMMGQICHRAISHLHFYKGDIVFSSGESPSQPKMYFVVKGHVCYTQDGCEDIKFVSEGQWASEATLWTTWSHCGQLKASETVRLTTVNAKIFHQIGAEFRRNIVWPQLYAQGFVYHLNVSQHPQPYQGMMGRKKAVPHLTDLADAYIVDVYALTESVFSDKDYEQVHEERRKADLAALRAARSSRATIVNGLVSRAKSSCGLSDLGASGRKAPPCSGLRLSVVSDSSDDGPRTSRIPSARIDDDLLSVG